MRQKGTDIVEGQDFYSQFRATPDEIRMVKQEKAEHTKKDEKQRQSEYWIKKETRKKK